MRLKKMEGFGGLRKHTAQGANYRWACNQHSRQRKRVAGEPVDIHN